MLQSLLVLIVKNEENDILEWICHHALIGFEKIVIYDNESTDNTAEVIKEASQHFPVEYVLWKDDMRPVPGLTKQGAAYTHAIEQYRNSTEWMCFLDADEFLIPPSNETLNTLLERMEPYKSFALNWMTFGSSNLENSQGRLVLEAFILRGSDTENINRHVKMFFKPLFAKKIVNPHFIDVGEAAVNLNKKPIQWAMDGIVIPNAILQSDWRIHHYIIRSREHWKRRVKRKQPSGNIREWKTFQGYDQNDILDYTAYSSAKKVWKKLLQLDKKYQDIPNIPACYDGPVQVASTLLCFVDEVTSNEVRGWACDLLIDTSIDLSVYIDKEFVAKVRCDLSRPDVKGSSINKEFVGFSFKLPIHYLDGQKHALTICNQRNCSVKFYAQGKKVEEFCFEELFQPKLIGNIDDPVNGNLRGWGAIARDPTHEKFDTKCHILVCLGHYPIGCVIADEKRYDVAAAHHIDPSCGFTYTIPKELRDGTTKSFRFFLLPEMIELNGSPTQIELSLHDQFGKIVSIAGIINNISNYIKKDKIRDPALIESLQQVSKNIEDILPNKDLNTLIYASWFYQHYKSILKKRPRIQKKESHLFSIICPVYRPILKDFRVAIESVLKQTHTNIEFILCDDGGGDELIVSEIQKIAAQDSRVKYIIAKENKGISDATNACLELATGKWIAFFDHDDVLVDFAIERMLSYVHNDKVKILYSDEDKIDNDGILLEPMLKPNFDYRYLLGCNYINHLTILRHDLVKKVGFLNPEYNGAQDHDLILRCVEQVKPNQIIHVPEVLYHWRKTDVSTASSAEAKPYVVKAGVKAVSDHLSRRKIDAIVKSYGKHSLYCVQTNVKTEYSVAIIIPFRDQVHLTKKCVDHVMKYTKRHKVEIVLVNNNSQKEETLLFLKEIAKHDNVTIINYRYAFNYSKINNLAAKKTNSDFIVLMNNDLFVMDDTWLDTMLGEIVLDPEVGAVGGKFLYENRTVQHCGVILGWMGVAGHAFAHESEYYYGYGSLAILPHQVSAVTAACMLVRRNVFEEIGGFDEKGLKIAFNDIDLCLKIINSGYKIVITPDFLAEHHESVSRGFEDTPEKVARFNKEVKVMRNRWGEQLDNDPFYSPSFARSGMPYFDLISFDES